MRYYLVCFVHILTYILKFTFGPKNLQIFSCSLSSSNSNTCLKIGKILYSKYKKKKLNESVVCSEVFTGKQVCSGGDLCSQLSS